MHASLQNRVQSGRGPEKAWDRYRHLVERLPNLVCELREGRIVSINPAGLDLLSAGDESLVLGRPFAELIAPAFLPILDNGMADWLAEGAPLPLRLRRLDGSFADVEAMAVPTGGDEAQGVVVVARDVSDLKRAALAVVDQESFLHAILDNLAEGIVTVDEDNRVVTANAAACRMFGASSAELAGLPFTELVGAAANRLDHVEPCAPAAVAARQVTAHRRDGTSFLVELAVGVIRRARRKFSVVAIRDVTKEVEARNRARRAEAQFIDAIESVPVGIALFDADDRLLVANERYRELFSEIADLIEPGVTFEAMARALVARGAVPDDAGRKEAWLRARLTRHNRPDEPFETRHGDRWLLIREHRTADGGTFTIVNDITERKQVETRLRESQKLEALGQLAGGVAHDFNNLLMIINGYTRRALANLDDAARVRDSLAQVISSTDKAATLTRQLLLFGRRDVLDRRILRLADQIDEIESLLRSLLGETIELVVERGEENLCVETDPGQLHQAIVNLALNARDAMPGGGRIWIAVDAIEADAGFCNRHPTARPGRYARIAVEDNGVGMDEETLVRVFEPFFTTKEQGKGTGLGLAMVYGFVKQSGGVVEATSRPGEGAVFSIFLPLTDRTPAAVSETERAACRARGETVLLVEDDDALRMLTYETLEGLGYRVIAAEDGLSALEAEDDHEGGIDLLLTDVVMPGLGGFELARAIRESRPGIKVVYMSGYPARGRLKKVDVPVDAPFLQKPFDADRLARCLRAALDHGKTTSSR